MSFEKPCESFKEAAPAISVKSVKMKKAMVIEVISCCMVLLVRGLVTSWLVGLQLFQPGGDPLIFVANSLEVKGEDTLGIGHRNARVGSTLSLGGHLLQVQEIVQA